MIFFCFSFSLLPVFWSFHCLGGWRKAKQGDEIQVNYSYPLLVELVRDTYSGSSWNLGVRCPGLKHECKWVWTQVLCLPAFYHKHFGEQQV